MHSHIQSHKLVHVSGVSYKSWVPRITLLDEKVGLTNMLSEWTLFIYRALTVYGNSLQQQQKTNVSTYGCSI